MSFTDVGPVLESVFSTGVHTTEDPDVEFALAVHIHPYPHGGVVTVGLRGYPKTEGWVLKGTTKPKASLSPPIEEHSGQVYVCSFPVFYAGKLENKNKICICIYFRATI